jgi:hypothetical protein
VHKKTVASPSEWSRLLGGKKVKKRRAGASPRLEVPVPGGIESGRRDAVDFLVRVTGSNGSSLWSGPSDACPDLLSEA